MLDARDEYGPCQVAVTVLRLASAASTRASYYRLQADTVRDAESFAVTPYGSSVAAVLYGRAEQKELCAARLRDVTERLTGIRSLNAPL